MKPRHKRLAIIVSGVIGLTVASLFVLNAFRSNLVFFLLADRGVGGESTGGQGVFSPRWHG